MPIHKLFLVRQSLAGSTSYEVFTDLDEAQFTLDEAHQEDLERGDGELDSELIELDEVVEGRWCGVTSK